MATRQENEVGSPTPGPVLVRHPGEVILSVLDRDHERARVDAFLSGGGPSLLLVTGAPGIGKTTLCQVGIELARERGYRVLACRPGEAEAGLSFSGLAGLLTDAVLDEVRPGMPAARQTALDTALARDDGSAAIAEPGVVGLGVLSVVTIVSARPVLIVIDDLQWLDAATAFVLDFALRRLGEAPVFVLAAARVDGMVGAAPLEAAFAEPQRSRLRLGPLSVGAVGRLVQDRLGFTLPRLAAVQLTEESGGNPLVALELARAVATRGSVPGPVERFLPSGDVMTLLGGRIAALTPPGREALQVLAAAARPDLALLASVIGDELAERAVSELAAAALATVEGAAVRCAHPLIASAAYAQMLPARRRDLHRRLAGLTLDAEERARHLAQSTDGPDEDVAATLDETARLARRRGATASAARLCELAVSLTAPADYGRVVRREVDLARRRLEAGDAPGALEAASRVLGHLPAGPDRVDALLLHSAIEQERGELAAARQWLTQALHEAGDDRAALARAHVAAGMTAWEDVDTERAHAVAAVGALTGHEDEDPTTAATALVLLAGTDFEAGKGLQVDLLDRALALEPQTDLAAMMRPSTQRAIFLGHAGRLAQALPAIAECVAAAQRQGDLMAQPHLLRSLAWMELGAGRLRAARVHIGEAMAMAEELALEDAYIWAVSGQIEAALGATQAAIELGERARSRARATGNPWAEIRALAGLGFSYLTADAAHEAAAALTAAERIGSAGRLVEIGWHRMHGDLIEALVGCGRIAEAVDSAQAFQERAAHTGHPWSVAVSARGLGYVAAAAGRLDEAIDAFERSLVSPANEEMAFERARTLLALGGALRRANRRRAAREALLAALTGFDEMGSVPWAQRARTELGAISGRAGAASELTAMQRRVAVLAAMGRTNAEIAQELFLSVRTVESHLAAAYRKLGARSRTELAHLTTVAE